MIKMETKVKVISNPFREEHEANPTSASGPGLASGPGQGSANTVTTTSSVDVTTSPTAGTGTKDRSMDDIWTINLIGKESATGSTRLFLSLCQALPNDPDTAVLLAQMETDLMTEEDERSRCAQRAFDLTWKQFELTEELRFCQLDMQEIYTPGLHTAERQLAIARHKVEAHRDRLLTAAQGVLSLRREAVMTITMARLAFEENDAGDGPGLHQGRGSGEMTVLPGSSETAQVYARMVERTQTSTPLPRNSNHNSSSHSASETGREAPLEASPSFTSVNISTRSHHTSTRSHHSDNSTTNNPTHNPQDTDEALPGFADDFIPSVVSTFEARQKRKAARNAPRDYLAEATAVLEVWRSQLDQPLFCEGEENGDAIRAPLGEIVSDGVTVVVQREMMGESGTAGSKGVPSRPVNWGDRSNPPRSVGVPRTTANQWESRGSDQRKYGGDFAGEYRGWFPMGPTVNSADSMSFNAHRGLGGNYASGGPSSSSKRRGRRGVGGGQDTLSPSLPSAGGGSDIGSNQETSHHRTTVRINGKLFLRSVPIWTNTTDENRTEHHTDEDGKRRKGVGKVTFTLYDPQSAGLWRVVATDTLFSPLDFSLDVPIEAAQGSKPGSKQGSKQNSRQPSRTPTMVVSPVLTSAIPNTISTSFPTKSVSFLSRNVRSDGGSGGGGSGGGVRADGDVNIAIHDPAKDGGVGGVGGAGVDWLTHLTTASQELIDSAFERTRDRALGPPQDELARCYRRITWIKSRLSILFQGLLNPLEADMATVLNDEDEEERKREERRNGPPKKIYDFMGLQTLEQAEAEEEGDSLNQGVEESPEPDDVTLSRQALRRFMLPLGTVDDVMRSIELRPGPAHYHVALVPWSELDPCVVIKTDPFHWMYLVKKYLQCDFVDAQKTRTLTPAALLYCNPKDQEGGGDVDAPSRSSPCPLNNRAIRWLRYVEDGLPSAGGGSGGPTRVGTGGTPTGGTPPSISTLQAQRRGSVYTGMLTKPIGIKDYHIRGNALLLLRHADRDLEGLNAWMEQYNEDNRARQMRARRALTEQSERRIRNYHAFRQTVYALADGYRRPFEQLHHCVGKDVFFDDKGQRKRPFGPISEEPSIQLCRALITHLHAIRDIADRQFNNGPLTQTLSQRINSTNELDEAFLLDTDKVLGLYGVPDEQQVQRFDSFPDPSKPPYADVRECLRWDMLEVDAVQTEAGGGARSSSGEGESGGGMGVSTTPTTTNSSSSVKRDHGAGGGGGASTPSTSIKGPVVELRTSDDTPWATEETRSHRRDNAPRVGHIVYAMYQLHCKECVRALGTCTFPGCSIIRSESHAELQDDEDREKGAMLVDDMHRLNLTEVANQRMAEFGTGRHPLEKAIRRYLLSYPLEYSPSRNRTNTRQGGHSEVSGRNGQGYYKGVGALTSAYGHLNRGEESTEEMHLPFAHTHSSPPPHDHALPHTLISIARQAYTSTLTITPGVVSTIGVRHPPVLVTPRLLTDVTNELQMEQKAHLEETHREAYLQLTQVQWRAIAKEAKLLRFVHRRMIPTPLAASLSGHDVMLATATRAEHVLPLIDGPGGAMFVDGRTRISDEKSIMKIEDMCNEVRSMVPHLCPVGREGYGHAHQDVVALQQEYEKLLHDSSPDQELNGMGELGDLDDFAARDDDKDSDEDEEKDSDDEEEVQKHVTTATRHLTSAAGRRSSLATAQKVRSSDERGRTSAGASRNNNDSISAGARRASVSPSAGARRASVSPSAGASRNNNDRSLVSSKGSDRGIKSRGEGKVPLLKNDDGHTDKSKKQGKHKDKDEKEDWGSNSRGQAASSSMLEMMSLPSKGHDQHTQESLFPSTDNNQTSRPTTTTTTSIPPSRSMPRAPPKPPRKLYTPPIEVPIHVLRRFLGPGLGGGAGYGHAPSFPYATEYMTLDRNGLGRQVSGPEMAALHAWIMPRLQAMYSRIPRVPMSRHPLQPPPTPTLFLDRICCERTLALTLPNNFDHTNSSGVDSSEGPRIGDSSKHHLNHRSVSHSAPSLSSKIRSTKGGSTKQHQVPPSPSQPALVFVHVQVLYGVLPPLPEEVQLIQAMKFQGSLYNKRKTHRLLANKPDRPALRLCPLHRLHTMQSGLTLHIYDVQSGVSKIITLQGRTLERLVMGIHTSPAPPSHGLESHHGPSSTSVNGMGLPAVGRYLLDACEEGLLHVERMPCGVGMVGIKHGSNRNNSNNNNHNSHNNNVNHPKSTIFTPNPSADPSLPPSAVGVGVVAGGVSRPVSGAKGVGFSISTRGGDVKSSLPGSGLAQGPGLGAGPGPVPGAEHNKRSVSSEDKKGNGALKGEVTQQLSSSQLVAAVSFEFKLPRPSPLEWRITEAVPLVNNNDNDGNNNDKADDDDEEEKDPILTSRTPLPPPQVVELQGKSSCVRGNDRHGRLFRARELLRRERNKQPPSSSSPSLSQEQQQQQQQQQEQQQQQQQNDEDNEHEAKMGEDEEQPSQEQDPVPAEVPLPLPSPKSYDIEKEEEEEEDQEETHQQEQPLEHPSRLLPSNN